MYILHATEHAAALIKSDAFQGSFQLVQDHLFQHGQEMRDLIALRKRNNIHSRSKVRHQEWCAAALVGAHLRQHHKHVAPAWCCEVLLPILTSIKGISKVPAGLMCTTDRDQEG